MHHYHTSSHAGTTAEAAVGVAEAAVGVAEAMDTGVSVGAGRATDAGHRVARRSKKLQKKRMRGVEVGRSVALDLEEWGQMEGWVESKLASGRYEVYWREHYSVCSEEQLRSVLGPRKRKQRTVRKRPRIGKNYQAVVPNTGNV